MPAVIQVKRGTASSWTSANTVLAAGEIGYETDTGKMKVGNGSTAWTSLGYTVTDGDISSVTAGTGLSGGGNSGGVTLSLSTPVAVAYGGTGQTTTTAATNALLPSQTSNSGKYLTTDGTNTSWGTVDLTTKTDKSTLTTTGDMYYASSASTPARIGIGSSGQVLTVASGIPSWATPSGGSTAWAQIGSSTSTGSTSYTFNFNDYEELWFVGHVSTSSQQRIKVNLNTYDPSQNEYSNFTLRYLPNSSLIDGSAVNSVDDIWKLNSDDNNVVSANLRFMMKITGCNKSTGFALAEWWCAGEPSSPGGYAYYNGNGIFSRAAKITSLRLFADDTFDVVNIRLYGRK